RKHAWGSLAQVGFIRHAAQWVIATGATPLATARSTRLSSQRAIDRRATDLKHLGNRGRPHAISDHLLDLGGINGRFAPFIDAARLRACYSLKLALPAQIGLKFREHA